MQMQDSDALAKGISNLDKVMAHLKQKLENCERQIEADTEELMWVEREIEHTEPKLKEVEESHAEKLKSREALADEITSSLQKMDALMKHSSSLVAMARKKDRALQKSDASYKLSVARGFKMTQ